MHKCHGRARLSNPFKWRGESPRWLSFTTSCRFMCRRDTQNLRPRISENCKTGFAHHIVLSLCSASPVVMGMSDAILTELWNNTLLDFTSPFMCGMNPPPWITIPWVWFTIFRYSGSTISLENSSAHQLFVLATKLDFCDMLQVCVRFAGFG